jgi:signal transduction histidine kinase
MKTRSLRFRNYGIAVLATGIAWAVDILLQDYLSESSGALFIAAAMVSAWYGGLGPGATAVGLTVILNLIFFDNPYLSLAVGIHGIERLVLFSAVALLVSWLTARSRRSEWLLRQLNRDLEEQVEKRTAALTESNQQLEAFCYTLAHDLRSPLRAVQGFAHLLLIDSGSTLGSEGKANVERIRNSAERMGRLILDLLAYTDLARSSFDQQAVDLEKISQNVRRLFADEIERTRAEVFIELSPSMVLGDPAGVERVLTNLMANALKFVQPERRPRIRIFSEKRMQQIRIWVEDNGIGLDEKYRERIFGVFERLPAQNHQGGTGIGLAIVKKSLEKMDGRVGVESKPGIGSRFWFDLPAAEDRNAGQFVTAKDERELVKSSV